MPITTQGYVLKLLEQSRNQRFSLYDTVNSQKTNKDKKINHNQKLLIVKYEKLEQCNGFDPLSK